MRALSIGEIGNMSVEVKPIAAFILGLTAGVFILLGAVVMSLFTFGALNMMDGMMMNMQGGMSMARTMAFGPILSLVGFTSGIIVVTSSVMLYTKPTESQVWGAIILAFSVVSILGGMGGFGVGLILGLAGGILALTWR